MNYFLSGKPRFALYSILRSVAAIFVAFALSVAFGILIVALGLSDSECQFWVRFGAYVVLANAFIDVQAFEGLCRKNEAEEARNSQ